MNVYQGLAAGGYNPVYVQKGHEYYRLLSANFVHFGIMHIAVNSYSLYTMGSFIEQLINTKAYIIILLVSGLCTNLLPYLLYLVTGYGASTVGGGISGVIFGLIGTVGALYFHYPHIFRDVARSLAINVALMLGISFLVPSISLSGHISGLIGGFVSSYILLKTNVALKSRFGN
jgi:rhomboid protease GluP